MKPQGQATSRPRSSGLGSFVFRLSILAGFVVTTLPHRAIAGGGSPVLQFVEPADGAVFSTLDEIPVQLRAFAPNDVFLSAEVFANNNKIATVSYCCAFCPCAAPQPGQQTTLQIPAPLNGSFPPPHPWQGWRAPGARDYQLTARAVGQNGTVLDAAAVNITVIDLTMHMSLNPDGTVQFVIPQGSMTAGSYDMEASVDLEAWTRLGAFSPGNVAAFFVDEPPPGARRKRFYRAVYVPAAGR